MLGKVFQKIETIYFFLESSMVEEVKDQFKVFIYFERGEFEKTFVCQSAIGEFDWGWYFFFEFFLVDIGIIRSTLIQRSTRCSNIRYHLKVILYLQTVFHSGLPNIILPSFLANIFFNNLLFILNQFLNFFLLQKFNQLFLKFLRQIFLNLFILFFYHFPCYLLKNSFQQFLLSGFSPDFGQDFYLCDFY